MLSGSSSEGNLILTVENGNPTRLLLAAMNKHGLGAHDVLLKDGEFYVGVMGNGKVRSTCVQLNKHTSS